MKIAQRYLAALIALAFAGGANSHMSTATAAGLKIACPTEIQASSISIAGAPAPWTADTAAPLRLHSAAPMNGPPAMRAYLVPDSTKEGKKISTSLYTLAKPAAEGNWIACMYGQDNTVVLGQRLPDGIETCAVTYTDRGRSATDIAIACK